ncbi:MAG: LEA type 2 family protein [Syntrophobacteraceae bacterium]
MRRAVLLLLLSVLIPSCTFYKLVGSAKLKTPDFKVLGCEVKKITSRKANVDFIISAYNPNPIGLKNIYVNYEISFEGQKLVKGLNASIELSPNSDNTLVVPAEIELDNLARALGPLLERILTNQKTIPLTINAVFHGKPTVYNDFEQGSLFSFEKRITKTIEIALPKDEMDKAKKQMFKEILRSF